ncbi:MAG: hypothetical protein ABIE42_03435 [Candidatus Eisenbacteria bacterium]
MAIPSRDRDRERLEEELQSDEYQELIQDLRRDEPFLRRFRTWADVIAFMRNGTSTDPRKDEVLRPIFRAHREDQDPRWRTILLTMFWPGLESISHKKRHWDEDSDELWQNVVWTFLRVVCRLDVNRRPARLVQKVVNDTIHHLHDEYRRRWDRMDRELAADPDEIESLAGGADGIDVEAIDLRQAHEREVSRLREHLDAGRIAESDFLLLVGTRLYGQSVAEYARRANLDYQVAKKRRQRAEAVIRRSEKEMRRSSETMSPSEALDPPFKTGDE